MALLPLLAGFLVLLLPAVSLAESTSDVRTDYKPYQETWNAFKKEYGRSYGEEEEERRYRVFVQNLKEMEEHNQKYLAKRVSYAMGVNQFSDQMDHELPRGCHLEEEVDDIVKGGRHKRQVPPGFHQPFAPQQGYRPPASWDWRTQQAVTPVGDQGHCMSCYAFGAATVIAAQLKLRTNGRVIPLSEQQLVDCSSPTGCNGGNAFRIMEYVHNAGGIMSAADYPYTQQTRQRGRPGRCRFDRNRAMAQVTGLVYSQNNERALQEMVARYGPVYTSIIAVPSLSRHRTGVYREPNCRLGGPNTGRHCLTVVGYGRDQASGRNYWIAKNSWGPRANEGGYIKIERGVDMCNIGRTLVVPVVNPTPRGRAASQQTSFASLAGRLCSCFGRSFPQPACCRRRPPTSPMRQGYHGRPSSVGQGHGRNAVQWRG